MTKLLPGKRLLPLLPLFAILLPWLFMQMSTALNTNHAWLTIAATRLLAGGHYLTDFYEPNPPLSVLLYIPGALFSKLTGVPVYYMPYVTGVAALGLSTLALIQLLRAWPIWDFETRTVFIGAYLLAGTVLTNRIFFAERDEFVIWGLLPFLIVQLAITRAVSLRRRLAWPVLILGAVCILIKPQFGLLPVIVILHRMIARRKIFPVLRDADFLTLTGAIILYALVLICFFSDYIHVILPDFISLYLPIHRPAALRTGLPCTLAVLAMFAAVKLLRCPMRREIQLCGAGAALSLGLFVLQDKGVYYHLIPAIVFAYCGIGLLIYGLSAGLKLSPLSRATATLAVLSAAAWLMFPPNGNVLTHSEYRELKLTKLAAEAGPQGSFFVFSEGMEMISQASLYGGTVHASRFPDFWWLYGTLRGWAPPAAAARYAEYVAADLRRWHPRVMAIDTNIYMGGGNYFDLIGWLSRDPAFLAEMAHYRKDGQFIDNRGDYFRGTPAAIDHPIVYDLYRRVP